MKYERLWTILVFILIVALTSCGNENETITGSNPVPGPSLSPANIAGSWTGTFSVNDSMGECGPDLSLSAKATFEQKGSTVTGTLEAPGPCGLNYPFQGTMDGNTLKGTLTGGLNPVGNAMGVLSGSTFQIATFNGYNHLMGTLYLHR